MKLSDKDAIEISNQEAVEICASKISNVDSGDIFWPARISAKEKPAFDQAIKFLESGGEIVSSWNLFEVDESTLKENILQYGGYFNLRNREGVPQR